MSRGLVVLIGAGPTSGAGICKQFALKGYQVALLARNAEKLDTIVKDFSSQGIKNAAAFPTDTSSASLKKAFTDIDAHFKNVPLKIAIFHVKNSFKKPFLETSESEFSGAYTDYVTGAFNFSQQALPRMLKSEEGGSLIFTGTLGALRTNVGFAAYGGTRAAVRMLAQALAKEFSEKGIHVVHAIANGGIEDADGEAQQTGKKMSAAAVADTYLWLAEQPKTLWCHEVDLRPALEKF